MSETKKTFKETKIGAFLSSKAPKVLAALGEFYLIKEHLV